MGGNYCYSTRRTKTNNYCVIKVIAQEVLIISILAQLLLFSPSSTVQFQRKSTSTNALCHVYYNQISFFTSIFAVLTMSVPVNGTFSLFPY